MRYVVLQVTQRNPEPEYVHYASFNVSVLKSDTVDTYDYTSSTVVDVWGDESDTSQQYRARGGYMDGISCTYSVCTVAGVLTGTAGQNLL